MTYAFDEKVKSMSFRQIVEAMVRGLRTRHVTVDMCDYGGYDTETKECYGCAATNAVCEISGVKFTPLTIDEEGRTKAVNASRQFLDGFEMGVDCLRRGYMLGVRDYFGGRGIDLPPEGYEPGPALDNDFTEDDLMAWETSVFHLPLERATT